MVDLLKIARREFKNGYMAASHRILIEAKGSSIKATHTLMQWRNENREREKKYAKVQIHRNWR